MADVKISALPPATTPLTGAELVPIVQSGVTDQVSVANLTAGRAVAAAAVTVDANSATAAVRITQTGAGNALVVEDSANPDATPFVVDASGNVGIGTSSPVNKLQVNGSFGRGAPVIKTTSFTLAGTENWVICNGTGSITITLPPAASWTGREVMLKTTAAFTVVSASSNVVPQAGGAAGTAILAASAGAWATLVSDGTNWVIMQS